MTEEESECVYEVQFPENIPEENYEKSTKNLPRLYPPRTKGCD